MTRLPVRILFVAVAYCLSGRVALLLAIPPGYASAIWPAAGIALAATLVWGYRIWPGIALGSFFVNIWTYFDASSPERVAVSVAIASGIALGAALQAVTGAFFIRRFVGFPAVLGRELDVIETLGLGGPLSCLINATAGTATLLASHLITPPLIAFTWFTWWVGDTLGVLIITPLALIGSVAPRADRHRRLLTVAVPLLVCSVMMLIAFFYASRLESRRIQNDFKLRTERLVQAVRSDLNADVEVLYGIKSLFESTTEAGRGAFRTFVSRALSRRPEFQALEWIPRVPEEERARFEQAALADGISGYRIWERRPDGSEAPARPGVHLPVYYAEPSQRNEAALGYDLATEPARRAALERAGDSGEATATRRVKLVQETGGQYGALVVLPVYSRETSGAEQRRRSLRGFALGVFRIGDLVSAALAGQNQEGIAFRLVDRTAPEDDSLLCSMRSGRLEPFNESSAFAVESDLPFAGRLWRMRFTPSAEYPFTHKSWGAWAVLAVGLLFTSLLGAFLLVLTGRTATVERMVQERTAQLTETTAELKEAQRELEARVRERTADLSRALADREEAVKVRDTFISIASHELKTPLTTLQLRLQALARASAEPNADYASHLTGYLAVARRQISRLSRLVNDLLDVSRIGSGRFKVELEDVDLAEIVHEVVARVEPDAARARSPVRVEVPDSVPVRSDRLRLEQVITNLIDNALKYGQGRPVEVRLAADGDHVILSVTDQGIGIDPRDLQRIFERFERAVSERNYAGLGLGLYITRAVVEALGGRVWAESKPGGETRFIVRLPRLERAQREPKPAHPPEA